MTHLTSDQLAALRRAVGDPHVLEGENLDDYLDPFSFTGLSVRPAAVVRPGNVAEVQAVLAVAREHLLPLWTVSRGRNFAYGGAEARVPGSVIVDLSRMDSVISVDEATGSAIVEPGVSFWALDEHLRASGSSFAVSVPDLSWGSPLGNTLERGFSYTTQNEHQANFCGLEVVLASGDVVRTGMGALPDSDAWTSYRGAYGPSIDGLFLQSNLGIVTKMGIWLRPRPVRSASCEISVPEEGQLGDLIDALRPLLIADVIQTNVVIGNALIVTSAITTRSTFYDGDGLMPEEALQRSIDEFGLGRWNAQFGLYGTPALIAARLAEIERVLATLPGATLTVREYDGDVDPADVLPQDRTQLGVPSNEAISMAAWRGGEPAHTDIGLVAPPTGDGAEKICGVMKGICESAGIDFAAGFMLFKRHLIGLAFMSYDLGDRDLLSRVNGVVEDIITAGAAEGLGAYRAHVVHMDHAAKQYSFNEHALLRTTETIKDALDPLGILSPGKQGIWPAGPERDAVHTPTLILTKGN